MNRADIDGKINALEASAFASNGRQPALDNKSQFEFKQKLIDWLEPLLKDREEKLSKFQQKLQPLVTHYASQGKICICNKRFNSTAVNTPCDGSCVSVVNKNTISADLDSE